EAGSDFTWTISPGCSLACAVTPQARPALITAVNNRLFVFIGSSALAPEVEAYCSQQASSIEQVTIGRTGLRPGLPLQKNLSCQSLQLCNDWGSTNESDR